MFFYQVITLFLIDGDEYVLHNLNYNDAILSAMASQITSVSIVSLAVC